MKKLPIVFACLFVVLLVAGLVRLLQGSFNSSQSRGTPESDSTAVQNQDSLESSAIRTEADITYHNSYLGFSYTIPKDWWLYSINEDNFDPDPSLTVNPEILDISYGTDAGMDYSYIDLIDFANLRESRRDNHIGLYISAETLEGINSIGRYMEYLEDYMLEPDVNTYQLLDSGRTVINGLQYEKRNYEVIRETANFIYVTYTRPVRNNYYLTIKASYWPQNKNAETLIENSLSKAMP